jgi:hypothetical protein
MLRRRATRKPLRVGPCWCRGSRRDVQQRWDRVSAPRRASTSTIDSPARGHDRETTEHERRPSGIIQVVSLAARVISRPAPIGAIWRRCVLEWPWPVRKTPTRRLRATCRPAHCHLSGFDYRHGSGGGRKRAAYCGIAVAARPPLAAATSRLHPGARRVAGVMPSLWLGVEGPGPPTTGKQVPLSPPRHSRRSASGRLIPIARLGIACLLFIQQTGNRGPPATSCSRQPRDFRPMSRRVAATTLAFVVPDTSDRRRLGPCLRERDRPA